MPHRVAVGQMTSSADVEVNLAACGRLARLARAAGCSLLSLPECCTFIGETDAAALAFREPLPPVGQPPAGPLLRRYGELARASGLWLSLGGVPESPPPSSSSSSSPASTEAKRYNTHVVLDASGNLAAAYRKAHLFDLDLPGRVTLRESRVTLAGDSGLVVVPDSPAGALGLSVCYDLRFPGLYSSLVFRHGAQVLLVPAAFTVPTGEAHWQLLLRARAVETQSYVLAAAQSGRHHPGSATSARESYGHACIVDPWGAVVATVAEGPTAEGIAVADLQLGPGGVLQRTREGMPLAAHRRPELYC